jgi:fucose 4-O-acetylase-like acetyltransferase
MPAFFIISGMFAIDHIQRAPLHAFVSRCGSIAWPYLLWGTVFIVFQRFLAPFMLFPPPEPGALASVIRLLLGETSWFLWTLFVCEALLLSVIIIPLEILFIISLVLSIVLPENSLGIFSNVVHFMPYLVLGALIGHRIRKMSAISPLSALSVALFIFAVLFVGILAGIGRSIGLEFLTGVLGSAALLLLAYGMTALAGRAIELLRIIGEASLIIFLLHPYFQSAARVIVVQLAGHTLAWQLLVPTMVGILGPTLACAAADRAGLQWLFRLSVPKKRPAVGQLRGSDMGH